MIQLLHVSKSYNSGANRVDAIHDINLTIQDGEIFGIIGLSGAGKSTLVRCINFLERPTEGKILFDGVDIGSLKKKELLKMRQSMSMIFQGFNLLAQRTALKNICYPMEIAGIPAAKAKQRALELLETVGLSDKANAYPSQLSGGQKQRVAIARALATNPKVLLCDEATSALDPNTTSSILDLLREINRTRGVTIIVITHEMRVIEQICHRVAVLDKSHVVELGNVSDVFACPQSQMAKELVLPKNESVPHTLCQKGLRVVFDGVSSLEPIVSNMILECHAAVNIIYAHTKVIDEKVVGQMVFQLPDDEKAILRIKAFLDTNHLHYQEEQL